jgi:hypothetical protein
MQKKHWSLLILGTVLLLSLAITFGLVGAAEEQPPLSLEQQVLRKEDLPEGAIIVRDRERITDLPGPLSPVNVPFRSEGFLAAYNADALYSSDLKNGQSVGDYVISIAYQFENSAQAKAAFQRQLELHTEYVRPGYFEQDTIELDIPVTARERDTSVTRVIRDRYSLDNNDNHVPLHEGMDLETYYFYSVKDDTVMLLMVDAFHTPDPVSQQILEELVTKLLQRRK